jgi:hypothetical protein
VSTYYDIILGVSIPHGSDILNQPATVTFTYPDGSRSWNYGGSILAWRTANVVCLQSPTLNIDAGWRANGGANGGTLAIAGERYRFPIVQFMQA